MTLAGKKRTTPKEPFSASRFFREKIFAPMAITIGLAILGAVGKIMFTSWSVPAKLEQNDKDHAAIRAEYQDRVKSLQRQISDLRGEIFWMQNGHAPPPKTESDK